MATNPVRIPINNLLLGSDYTGKFYIGAQQKEVNLILDTGSSTIAVESQSYDPQQDADPLNNGWLILGGGEEATDLYSGEFQTAAVLSDDWYSVNLKAVIVGSDRIPVSPPTFHDSPPTNAIVDSGTNSLFLSPAVYKAILAKLPSAQRNLVRHGGAPTSSIDLTKWPTLTFVLQGATVAAEIQLVVKPENYWQLDAGETGQAQCVLLKGSDVQSILGLPLMNGYFTIFDDTANIGVGAVKFAAIK